MGHFPSQTRSIGILTSGGDCPGLNAAIRGITKAAIQDYGIKVFGIQDGFRGLVENRIVPLDHHHLSGVLTLGGTILGTSRDKPRKMRMGGKALDMSATAADNARNHGFDCVVCLGGGGTQKNAWHLHRATGMNVLTLPKTIDNDVGLTDVTFGYDTAVQTATEAIDRLHTTATSHDRIIVVEVMGHNAGWLALGAAIAGGADVVLIPEIPYDINAVRDYLLERQRRFGKKFSIVVVAEGALSREDAAAAAAREASRVSKKKKSLARGAADADDRNGHETGHGNGMGSGPDDDGAELNGYKLVKESLASRLARELQVLTRTEARVTSLGHVQRGGVPTAADRVLCTRLGVKAAELLAAGTYNVMVAVQNGDCVPVPLEQVAGLKKLVPVDHPWIQTARRVGTSLGISDRELRERIEQGTTGLP
ncbi:MAG: ATP-dependent 6-phosphofructokinase [Candidatus Krumholzibacteriia bacterium]